MTMAGRNEAELHLKQLGLKTEYPSDYAPDILESFDNKHPNRD